MEKCKQQILTIKMNQYIKRYKPQIQNIGVYFLASLIPLILSMAVNPLIALNMDPDDYAIVGYFNSFNTLIAPLITFYALHYYSKRYFELNDNDRKHLKSTIMQSLVYLSFLLALVSFSAIYIYTKLFNTESTIPFIPYALLSVFTIPLTGIFSLMLTDYKMQKNSKAFFNLSVSKGIIGIVLALLFVVLLKYGALGRMTATFLVNFLLFIWCIFKNLDTFKQRFDWTIFKAMIRFIWPLTLAAMLGFFSSGYDRVFLERLGDVNELGYYVVAVQIAGYITVFTTAIGSTFQPDIYEGVVKRNWKKTAKYLIVTIGSTCFVVVGFIIVAPFVVDLLTAGKYTYSAKYVRILALSQITSILYYSVSKITIVLGLTQITLINKIVGSIISVLIFSYFISKWHFMGAAWGQVISFVVFMVGNLVLLAIWKRKRILRILRF